eukprot:CAMPEP_0117025884 /NCGR_PEP_ID=MMETSP0472-20121206/19078_1 /TAXON_ID=693140 ORGANISM="Tiarina fusus, Strain LIS" /NCGR_SAMPLE_ID=MMETSP0472 /ASSEMBLY_ACC=CAM_ASM_000603 /LENGTH=258 /DNA_ID=CAMNT_0004732727 /DNA_START=8 /DNA_END=788 /DNA_ORIENTATION=+
MLLDGSFAEDTSKQEEITKVISEVFEVKTPLCCSSFAPADIKILDIPALLENRLKSEENDNNYPKYGRIGPKEVRFHRHKPSLREGIDSPDGIQIRSKTTFASMRTNSCVYEGKWMFEVTLGTAGVQQIGWATLACPFTDEAGVGDAEDSYAYDGKRQKKWSISPGTYGEDWAIGDVIGCCLDLEGNKITFYRNGKSMGVAFDSVKSKEEGLAYFPTASLSFGERSLMNYGSFPFQYPVDDFFPIQPNGDTIYANPTT